MSVYYPSSSCAGSTVPDYYCNPCPTYEFGRIRSVAFVRNSYTFSNPASSSEWATVVSAGTAVVIYETQGSYDGGTTTELPGFGDLATVNGNTTHSLTFRDRNYADNCDFYNALRGSSDYYMFFRTSSKIHSTGAPVTVSPKNPIADDINSIVAWEALVKWTSSSSPCAYDTPDGIFDTCYVHQS